MTHEDPIGRRAALLINCGARAGEEHAAATVDALNSRGLKLIRIVQVSHPDELKQAAAELIADAPDRLILGGGDGTLSAIAPMLAKSKVALGVIPLGTANDFARSLNIPVDLQAAAEVASGFSSRHVDLARANEDWFLNVAHVGVAADATRGVTPWLKKLIGRAAYAVVGLHYLIRAKPFRATITTEEGASTIEARELIIGNGRYYGGGVLVSGGSELDDGELVIYALGSKGRWEVAGTMALLKFQVPLDRPGELFLKARRVVIETEPPQFIDLDGEIRGKTPLTIEVVPGALRVLAPSAD